MKMEDILHYVWQYKLYDLPLRTSDGNILEVIDTGIPNRNGGADFSNAKIKIGEEMWVGDVEIHISSNDWTKHKHHTNKAYNSVILHVVNKITDQTLNADDRIVPQCCITYPKSIDDNFSFLIHSNIDIPCANSISLLDNFHLQSWLNTLLIERLERKANDIDQLLSRVEGSWEDVFYVLLSRNFGFGLNSDSFQRLALSLPLKYLRKQGDNLIQLEALLLGQAGLLDTEHPKDDYQRLLASEYQFLNRKYELKSLDKEIFKNMRARPSTSPQLRLAQLATLLHNSQALFSKILNKKDIGQLRLIFHVNASEYWQTHYSFGNTSPRKSKYIGDGSLDIILINTVVPILFAYGKHTADEELCERALSFLENIKSENNTITKSFAKWGLPLNNACDSQAHIQLKREYCEKRKCLYCRIGHRLLSAK